MVKIEFKTMNFVIKTYLCNENTCMGLTDSQLGAFKFYTKMTKVEPPDPFKNSKYTPDDDLDLLG